MANDELQHVGVMGMRWGVRRQKNERLSSLRSGGKRDKQYKKEVSRNEKRFKASMGKTEQKRIKRVLEKGGGVKKVMVRDAGKSVMVSGLLSYGLSRFLGADHRSAMGAAAFAGALSGIGSVAMNGFTYKQYKDSGGT